MQIYLFIYFDWSISVDFEILEGSSRGLFNSPRVNYKLYIKPVNTVVVPVHTRIGNLLNTSQKLYHHFQLVRFRLKRLKRKKKWEQSIFKPRLELGTSQIRIRPDNYYMAVLSSNCVSNGVKWKRDGRRR